jgi:hypothetical protein
MKKQSAQLKEVNHNSTKLIVERRMIFAILESELLRTALHSSLKSSTSSAAQLFSSTATHHQNFSGSKHKFSAA